MQTAAAYIRVSTEEQTEYSPDSQRKKIQEYADRHELLLPEQFIYLDEGLSGRSAGKRPAFLRMICTAKQKPRPFSQILVWKFSRFARSRQDSILYKSMLRKEYGIDVVSITEQLSDDPTAILIEALLEAMDEYYSINLAQEVRRGMNEKFSRGGVVSSPPFGYRMGAEHFEIDEEKAPLVRMIFQEYQNGSSFRQIAAHLNEWNIRTRRGNPFESRAVKYILTNPVYLGKLRRTAKDAPLAAGFLQKDNVQIVDGKHSPLIDQKIYAKVQEKIAQTQKSHPEHTPAPSAAYMLHGLVYCSQCKSALTSAERGKSLQCSRYAKGKCSLSHHVRLEKLNRAVLAKLEEDLPDGSLTIPVRRMAKPFDAGTVRLLLDQEARRLERIKNAYESGADTLEEYKERKADALRRIQELQKELDSFHGAEAEQPFASVPVSLHRLFRLLRARKLPEHMKNVILRSFVSRIVFYRTENAVRLYYHARR